MKFSKNLTNTLLIAAMFTLISYAIQAQDKNSKQSQPSVKKKVAFKIPDGFMPAEMPPDKKGLLMLNPKKPAGIFVAYTPENQKSQDFIIELIKPLAGFFVDDKEAKFEWKEASLQSLANEANETGKLFTTNTKDKELQVIAYIRTIVEGQDVVYGYFAMKDLKSKKNSADFVDAFGKGVKEFDVFRKTLGIGK